MHPKSNNTTNWPLIKRSFKLIFDMIIARASFLKFKNGKPAVVLEDLKENNFCKYFEVLFGKTSIASIFALK